MKGKYYVVRREQLGEGAAKLFPHPAGNETAMLYLWAFAEEEELPKDLWKLRPGDDDWIEALPKVKAWRERNARVLEATARATEMPLAEWPILFGEAPAEGEEPFLVGMAQPYLKCARAHVRARCLLACLAASEKKPEEAIAHIKAGFGVSRHVGRGPLISCLVSIACDAILLDALEDILCSNCFRREHLEQVAALLDQRVESLGEQVVWVDYEECAALQVADMSRLTRAVPELASSAGSVKWLWENRLTRLIIPDRTARRQIQEFFGMLRDAVREANVTPKQSGAKLEEWLEGMPMWNFAGRLFLPVLSRAHVQSARRRAHLELARVAVAAKRSRMSHGLKPTDLKELSPRYLKMLPVDPLALKPFGYAKDATGWRVWSTGVDGKDDGGKRGHDDEIDLVFFIEEAPGRRPPK